MNDALPIPPERLLEETKWLQSLARCLAGPDDSDDLAQATWLRALEQQPDHIRGLRPWLRTVLRNAFQRGRDEQAARLRRETAAARPEAMPSAADLAARASLHRAVVDAVLSLDEPARSTVLLRFFENRKPQEIARLQNTAVATVHTRLHRAFAILRERLDGEQGGRACWAPLAAAPSLAGVLLMSLKAKVAVAACVLLLALGAALAWKALTAEPDTPASAARGAAGPLVRDAGVPTTPRSPESSAGAAPATAPASPDSRTEVAAPASPAPVMARVHVSDEQGNDVSGATVAVVSGAEGSGTTDARGEVRLPFPEPRVVTLHAVAAGFAPTILELVPIARGSRIQVDLTPLATLRVRVTDTAGTSIAGATVDVCSHGAMVDASSQPPDYQEFHETTGDDGVAIFRGVPALHWFARVHAKGFAEDLGRDWNVRVGPEDATVVLKPAQELTIRFENAFDQPVPGVCAHIWPDVAKRHLSIDAISDTSGTISLGRPAGVVTQVTMRSRFRFDPSRLDVPADQTTVTVRVTEPAPLSCHVTREDGIAVYAAILEYAKPRQAIPVAAQEGAFMLEGQTVQTAPSFRFIVPDYGATDWKKVDYTPKTGSIDLVAHPSVAIKGQIVDTAGTAVAGAVIRIDAEGTDSVTSPLYPRPNTEVTTRSDEHGGFTALLGGSPYYVVHVATAIGPCARQLIAVVRATEPTGLPFKIAMQEGVQKARAVSGNGVCDVGGIVVPSAGGALVVTSKAASPGLSEAVVTPLAPLAGAFPPRRAPIRPNRKAEFSDLPEGEYDVTVLCDRRSNFIAGMFGSWGTRVRITGGQTTEVTIEK